MQKEKITGMWIGKTGNSNAWYHIYPFVESSKTKKLYVVRHEEPQRTIKSPKVEFITFPSNGKIKHLKNLFFTGYKVLKNKDIDYIVSFSLVPWGIIALLLAKLF